MFVVTTGNRGFKCLWWDCFLLPSQLWGFPVYSSSARMSGSFSTYNPLSLLLEVCYVVGDGEVWGKGTSYSLPAEVPSLQGLCPRAVDFTGVCSSSRSRAFCSLTPRLFSSYRIPSLIPRNPFPLLTGHLHLFLLNERGGLEQKAVRLRTLPQAWITFQNCPLVKSFTLEIGPLCGRAAWEGFTLATLPSPIPALPRQC